MVFVDALFTTQRTPQWRYDEACHMSADSVLELIDFARSIGLKAEWIQTSQDGILHFDLTKGKRKRAIQKGAKEVDAKTFLSRAVREDDIEEVDDDNVGG